MPPASRKTPEAGVTHPLHWRTAITRFNAPVKVAATSSGATYLRQNVLLDSLVLQDCMNDDSMILILKDCNLYDKVQNPSCAACIAFTGVEAGQ